MPWRLRSFLSNLSACPYRKSNPHVLMMEAAKEWNGLNVADGLYGAADRCILAE